MRRRANGLVSAICVRRRGLDRDTPRGPLPVARALGVLISSVAALHAGEGATGEDTETACASGAIKAKEREIAQLSIKLRRENQLI